MCGEGDHVVGVSDAFRGWTAGWTFVSLFYLFSVVSLIRRSKCTGETPDGEDFEAFIGAEKATELKSLFTNWVHKIYRELLPTIHRHWRLLVFRSSRIRMALLRLRRVGSTHLNRNDWK